MKEWAGSRSTGVVTKWPDPAVARRAREDRMKWQATVPISFFETIGKRFHDAGINIYAFCTRFFPQDTNEGFDRTFQFAKALGAKVIDTSIDYPMLKRVAPIAEKNKMVIGVHGHVGAKDSNQFSTRDTFLRAFAVSKWVSANLDIGHYWAAGGDPVEFIESFHGRMTNLHIKDRISHDGPAVPFGEGNTPIRDVLLLLKREKYPIPAFIENEYPRTHQFAVQEVKRPLQFCEDVIATG